MRNRSNTCSVVWITLLLLCWAATLGLAQSGSGSLTGQITDPSGAAIPGATVTVMGPHGLVKAAETNMEGQYTVSGLVPGKYKVRVTSPGFSVSEQAVEVSAGRSQSMNLRLALTVEKQEVQVTDRAHVDVDPSQNVGAIVLKGKDLDDLSDNPDDLESDLQALAGPSAGPNGGQIYIDGFTGGRLPPKESIREIRINQNPFSAEYDKLGYGRIEILTKPGSDQYHGQVYLNFGDSVFNSRNPFSPTKPPYQTKMFGGNFGGPLISHKASFFVDMDRRSVQETSIVSALVLDPSFNITPFSSAVLNPTLRTTVSPRIDYQLSTNNTLTGRYTYAQTSRENEGIGQFSLPSRAFNTDGTEHTFQITETAVLNTKAVNETRFQFIRRRNNQNALSSDPTISVLDAFTSGGAGVGLSYSNEDRYELQNMTSLTQGTHLLKFGVRLRGVSLADESMQNYNGTFTFTSLNAYRITELGLQNGMTPEEIRAAGGGPSQFSLTGGNPLASIRQFDVGLFAQDDWRLRPNFSLSMGLRYETQNHISDHHDVAPRIGFAWGLGGGRQPKTVVRGGFGLFYDRFDEGLTLQAMRLNGVNQQQYLVPFPAFYPNVPPLSGLEAARQQLTIRQVDPSLQAPYIVQSAIGIERQLPKNIALSLTYTNSRGVHMLRSRNINAPLPGTWDPQNPSAAVRPYGDVGNIYAYESSGLFKQSQLITSISARVSPGLTLFGFYVMGKAESNTDGAGSFPQNQYDLSSEFGPAGFDVRHRAFIGGSIVAPFAFRFSPFITMSSGHPFNITVGRDLNGDSLFNDRPAFATDLSRPSVVSTPYGVFDTRPMAGQIIVPRNYAEGPGQFTINLRLSRTFGFGGERSSSPTGEFSGGPRRGGHHGGPPGGGNRGFGGGGGFHALFGDASTGKRYNLVFSASARNLLNHVNLAPPIGNLSSPLFGESNSIAGGFGPFGSTTANRRLEFQLRFMF